MSKWVYQSGNTEFGVRRSASIDSAIPVAVGGGANLGSVCLQFVQDPVTGPACFVQLAGGQFRQSSAVATRIDWQVDGGDVRSVLCSVPEETPGRLSLREPRDRWFELKDSKRLTITFRGEDYANHRVMFDVTGLDRSQLNWDQQRYAEQYWEKLAKRTAGDD